MRALRSSGDTNVILEQLETRRLYSAVLLDAELHRPPMCIADLNHDGKADAVVAYRRTSGGFSTTEIDVQLNNGKGTFVAGTPSGFYDDNNPLKHQIAADIAVGDLDGDGNPDIALKLYSTTGEPTPVGGASSNIGVSISVVPFFGDGKGGFAQGKEIALPHTLTRSLASLVDILSPNNGIAIGDVDGDGFGDIVSWIGGDNIAVALMAGRGPRQTISLDGSFGPRGRGFTQTLGLADMDGDKHADLVACVNDKIFYTSFASGFAKPVSIPPIGGNVDANIDGMFLADADGDGIADDLVVMSNNRLIVGTTGGLASGAAAKWTWRKLDGTYGERAENVLVGDVDGDGYSDLFTVTVKANHDIAMNAIRNIKA